LEQYEAKFRDWRPLKFSTAKSTWRRLRFIRQQASAAASLRRAVRLNWAARAGIPIFLSFCQLLYFTWLPSPFLLRLA
jgi:hypothetical protein